MNEPDHSGPGWGDLAPAWLEWHSEHEALTAAATAAIVAAVGVGPGSRVLDLASGAGDPALALARAVSPGGLVTASDASPEMVAAARVEAGKRGQANLEFRVAPAEALPFADASFDAVTCRFGLMFLDAGRALGEAKRVLVPGGRLAAVAWGSPGQPYFDGFDGVVVRHFGWPPPEPGEPGLFRYARPGALRAALEEAGFGGVREEARAVALRWPGTVEGYLACRLAFAPQVAGLLEGLEPARRAAVLEEVRALAASHRAGPGLLFPGEVVLAWGERP